MVHDALCIVFPRMGTPWIPLILTESISRQSADRSFQSHLYYRERSTRRDTASRVSNVFTVAWLMKNYKSRARERERESLQSPASGYNRAQFIAV